jgi:hypothetical protein
MYLLVSLRKLVPSYTGNCVRVTRHSDNTEQDFGFVGGVVDFAGIASFCGASIGSVSRWYFQSNTVFSNFSTQPYLQQTTISRQPRIYSGSVFYTRNSRYYLSTGHQAWLNTPANLSNSLGEKISDGNHIISTVNISQTGLSFQGVFEERLSSNNQLRVVQYSTRSGTPFLANFRPSGSDSILNNSSTLASDTEMVITTSKNGTLYEAYFDGTFKSSITDSRVFGGDTLLNYGKQDVSNNYFLGYITELVIIKGFDSTLRAAIMVNQKNYYGI